MKTLRLNIALMTFLAWLNCVCITSSETVYRDFTSTNGCTIKGVLLDYNAGSQIAAIQREGRTKPCRASITAFCEVDRHYIQAWAQERDFRDSVKISVRWVDVEKRGEIKDKRYDPQFIKCQACELKLVNPSDTAFVKTEIEYCIFYKQIERSGATRYSQEGVLCSRFDIGTMTPDSQYDLKTESVMFYDEDRDTSLFGSSGSSSGEIEGIWLRLTCSLSSGERVTRDYRIPQNINSYRDWTTNTIAAGLNRNPNRSITRRAKPVPVELPPIIEIVMK